MANVLLEGMACGLPVIASRVRGNTDIVTHDGNGFLCDLENPAAFRGAFREIMDPATTLRLGKQARALVEKHYSWERTAREYQSLIQGRNAHAV